MRNLEEAFKFAEKKGIISKSGKPKAQNRPLDYGVSIETASVGTVMADVEDMHTPGVNRPSEAETLPERYEPRVKDNLPTDIILRNRRKLPQRRAVP